MYSGSGNLLKISFSKGVAKQNADSKEKPSEPKCGGSGCREGDCKCPKKRLKLKRDKE